MDFFLEARADLLCSPFQKMASAEPTELAAVFDEAAFASATNDAEPWDNSSYGGNGTRSTFNTTSALLDYEPNYWGLLIAPLPLLTALGNVLVILSVTQEKILQERPRRIQRGENLITAACLIAHITNLHTGVATLEIVKIHCFAACIQRRLSTCPDLDQLPHRVPGRG